MCAFATGMSILHFFGDPYASRSYYSWEFLVSALFIVVVSLVDDCRSLSTLLKLGVHIVAVVIAISAGIVIDQVHLPGVGAIQLGVWGGLISFLWILGLTNATNFMDGIDGLAASNALIASVFFCYISYSQGSVYSAQNALLLSAALIGFLPFNLPPARIFMGDVGSTFLGFVLAVMAIVAARYDSSHTSLFVIPLIMFHFIFDTALTFFRRLARGEQVLRAHKTHLYQLLNQLGYSHKSIGCIYSSMATFHGVLAILMVNIPGDNRLWLFVPVLGLQIVYASLIVGSSRRAGLL